MQEMEEVEEKVATVVEAEEPEAKAEAQVDTGVAEDKAGRKTRGLCRHGQLSRASSQSNAHAQHPTRTHLGL